MKSGSQAESMITKRLKNYRNWNNKCNKSLYVFLLTSLFNINILGAFFTFKNININNNLLSKKNINALSARFSGITFSNDSLYSVRKEKLYCFQIIG